MIASKGTFAVLMSALVAAWFLTGCQPRGETRSVHEVLALSKARYQEAAESAAPRLDGAVRESLQNMAEGLEALASSARSGAVKAEEFQTFARPIAAGLTELSPRAGYTARPAFGELIQQLHHVGANVHQGEVSASTVTLLVARIYGALAGECETTRFAA